MGPDPVVVAAPVFGDDLSFLERIKDLAIQEFISQVAVKALAVAVFPRAPRHDVGRKAGPTHPFYPGEILL